MRPLSDNAPRSAVIHEFDIPDDDGLWSEQTKDFGSIRTIGMRLLTPLQEKHAVGAAKGDALQLAFELGRRALAYVTSDLGGRSETFQLVEQDGSSTSCWAQMHPRVRALVMQANAEVSVPNERTQAAFLASRRILA
jgi:hypothetical protein